MKYMGSKRWMLRNGLGHLITDEVKKAERFLDFFTGSGVVSHFAATTGHPIEVHAYDLQQFCVALADSVVSRSKPVDAVVIWKSWRQRAEAFLSAARLTSASGQQLPVISKFTQAYVGDERLSCEATRQPITRAYGGHYYSRAQAIWIDALRATLPEARAERSVCLAALIQAASQCAASPGHTAQPFQPTRSAKPFLFDAWRRDVPRYVETALTRISSSHAQLVGGARAADANAAALDVKEGDLVFLDPPYSGVHYSRFYHVLETIARGSEVTVSGVGRYPPPEERPKSRYSLPSEAPQALDSLLGAIAKNGGRAILTFPEHDCSNGLSGEEVEESANKYFKVQRKAVENRFSTLGGTKKAKKEGNGRTARQKANELIFILTPR